MIRLNLKSEPYWLDLFGGVRILVRPATAQLITEAQSQSAADRDIDEEDAGATSGQIRVARAAARLAILDWEGVEDAHGEPAEVTDEHVEALIDIAPVYFRFRQEYLLPAFGVVLEGNGSAPSPNGTTAEAPNTAAAASSSTEKPARTAPRAAKAH